MTETPEGEAEPSPDGSTARSIRTTGTSTAAPTNAVVDVCAAVVVDRGRVLVARRVRPPELRGRWEFPGGKLEAGESPAECLARELEEELGLRVEVGAALGASATDEAAEGGRSQPALRLTAYAARIADGASTSLELLDGTHDRSAWVTPEELRDLDLAPLDVPLVEAALRELARAH